MFAGQIESCLSEKHSANKNGLNSFGKLYSKRQENFKERTDLSNVPENLRDHYGAVDLKRPPRLHSGEMPYACQHCNKKFNSAYDLKRHLRIHTGEKPYVCQQCSKKFTDGSSLKKHLRKIHIGKKTILPEESNMNLGRPNYFTRQLKVQSGNKIIISLI